MKQDQNDDNKLGIADYAALKTAIANGEEQLVKDLLAEHTLQELEKDYLIDLAELTNNHTIIEIINNS